MTDIIIGARRPPKRRAFRQVAIVAGAIVAAVVIGLFVFRRTVAYEIPDVEVPDKRLTADLSGAEARVVFAGSSLSRTGKLPVLRLAGSPEAIGAAHGRLLAQAVRAVHRTFAPTIEHAIGSDGLLGELTHDYRLDWALRNLAKGIPGHQLVEIAAMGAGTEVSAGSAPSYRGLVRDNAALDIGRQALTADAFGRVARGFTIIAPTERTGGRFLVGRTFGLPGTADGGALAATNRVVSFVHPDGVIPFVSVGWPGLAGVVSGVNAEGIAVFVHPGVLKSVRADRSAQPIPLLARDILENARTLPDAVAILEHATALGAAHLVVIDAKARTWAAIGRGPEAVFIDDESPPEMVTGILESAPFAEDPKNDRAERTLPARTRAARAAEILASSPPASAAEMAALLRDRRATGGVPLPPGHRGAIADPSAQHAIIFDASAMVLYVSEGPGALGRFVAFDLRYELSGQGARPAPPPALAAAGPERLDDAHRVIAARAALSRARKARGAGDVDAAREHAARAMAIAPETPEVLLFATELARKAGDTEHAAQLGRRYLDTGPDDILAADRIRALQ